MFETLDKRIIVGGRRFVLVKDSDCYGCIPDGPSADFQRACNRAERYRGLSEEEFNVKAVNDLHNSFANIKIELYHYEEIVKGFVSNYNAWVFEAFDKDECVVVLTTVSEVHGKLFLAIRE